MLVRVVVVGALAALTLGFGIAGSRAKPWHLGSQGGSIPEYVALVPPDARLCQEARLVPEGTANLGMTAGTYGAPGTRMTVTLLNRKGDHVVTGEKPAGWRQGNTTVRLGDGLTRAIDDGRLCITNHGPGRIALAGLRTDPDHAARVGARGRALGMVSVEYLDSGRSFWAQLGTISDHLVAGRSFWGRAAVPLAIVLILLAAAASVITILKAARP